MNAPFLIRKLDRTFLVFLLLSYDYDFSSMYRTKISTLNNSGIDVHLVHLVSRSFGNYGMFHVHMNLFV